MRKLVRVTKRGTFSRNSSSWPQSDTSGLSFSRWSIWPWVKTKRRLTILSGRIATVPTLLPSASKSSRCLIHCAAIHDLSVWSQRSLALRRASDRLNRQRVLNVIPASPIACRSVHHFPAYDRCFHFCIANGFRFEVKDVVTQDDHVSQFAWRD